MYKINKDIIKLAKEKENKVVTINTKENFLYEIINLMGNKIGRVLLNSKYKNEIPCWYESINEQIYQYKVGRPELLITDEVDEPIGIIYNRQLEPEEIIKFIVR